MTQRGLRPAASEAGIGAAQRVRRHSVRQELLALLGDEYLGASRAGASDTADATQAQGDGRALSPHLAGSGRRVRPSPATRLFRQPGGFKGFGPVEILDDSRGPAMANRPVQRRWRSEDVASRDRATRPSDATTRKIGAR